MNALASNAGDKFNDKNVQNKSKRIAGIVFIGLLMIATVGVALFFRFAHPVGSGRVGLQIDSNLFSSAWTERPVFLVGLGDSVTAGFGARKGYSYFNPFRIIL